MKDPDQKDESDGDAMAWLRRHSQPLGCGSCKGTGYAHLWNAGADLVPAEPRRACPACNGSGWVSTTPQRGNAPAESTR